MISTITRMFLTFLMPIVIFFGNASPSALFINPEGLQTQIDYSFENEDAASAAGEITLTSKKDGDYEVYWADEDGERLQTTVGGYTVTMSELATIDVDNGTGSADIQQFTYIPEQAESVVVYYKNLECAKIDLPENKKTENSDMLYSFGVLSDVHFNRYYFGAADVATLTLPNALNFLDELGVDMVAMPGDLSSSGEKSAFTKFNDIVSDYDFPVYTVTGNHDVSDEFDLQNWNTYINEGVYGSEKAQGVLSVADNSLDFAYNLPGTNDIFIFLCQYAWSYGNADSSRILKDEQLDWLQAQLNEYKDKRVYLFFHTFTSDVDGNPAGGCGNLVNPGGATYDLVFTPGAPDEVRFKNLLSEYKNVIYFSGHSHWEFDMQKYNPNLNIADYGGRFATSVHVPSVSSPRYVSDKDDEYDSATMRKSEGYYIEVYSDKIVLKGIDFLKGQFLAYATYEIVGK